MPFSFQSLSLSLQTLPPAPLSLPPSPIRASFSSPKAIRYAPKPASPVLVCYTVKMISMDAVSKLCLPAAGFLFLYVKEMVLTYGTIKS